jgi:hypothetical protein
MAGELFRDTRKLGLERLIDHTEFRNHAAAAGRDVGMGDNVRRAELAELSRDSVRSIS